MDPKEMKAKRNEVTPKALFEACLEEATITALEVKERLAAGGLDTQETERLAALVEEKIAELLKLKLLGVKFNSKNIPSEPASFGLDDDFHAEVRETLANMLALQKRLRPDGGPAPGPADQSGPKAAPFAAESAGCGAGPVLTAEAAATLAAKREEMAKRIRMNLLACTVLLPTPGGGNKLEERIMAQAATLTSLAALEAFEARWTNAIQNLSSIATDNRGNGFNLLMNAEYDFLYPGYRRPWFSEETIVGFWGKALEYIKGQCPCREEEAEEILACFTRRLLGDSTATFPVLYGPPGAGKTHIARVAAGALTAAGIPTEVVFYSMAMAGVVGKASGGNEMQMYLCGTDSHWSNGDAGQIYKTASASGRRPLVLVVLDEAEKAPEQRNLLVNLLDPDQPLSDAFLAGFFPGHDLRDRVLFLLTANDIDALIGSLGDPLGSRLKPLEMRAYTREEMVEVVSSLGRERLSAQYPLPDDAFRRLAEQAVDILGLEQSFRTIMDLVGDLAFKECFPGLRPVGSGGKGPETRRWKPEPGRKLGFI